jgi:hypothetical protein
MSSLTITYEDRRITPGDRIGPPEQIRRCFISYDIVPMFHRGGRDIVEVDEAQLEYLLDEIRKVS